MFNQPTSYNYFVLFSKSYHVEVRYSAFIIQCRCNFISYLSCVVVLTNNGLNCRESHRVFVLVGSHILFVYCVVAKRFPSHRLHIALVDFMHKRYYVASCGVGFSKEIGQQRINETCQGFLVLVAQTL